MARLAVLLLMTATQALLQSTDLLMLGWLADPTSVGVYAVAARVADLVTFALTAINTIFAPSIAALHARGDRTALQAMVTTTAWWATLAGLVVALPLFGLAGFVLSIFGAGFSAGETPLRILLAGQIVNAAAGSVGFMLTMTGHERQAAVVLGGAAVGAVALNAIFISPFGLAGAAMATALSVTGWNWGLAVLVWRRKLAYHPQHPRSRDPASHAPLPDCLHRARRHPNCGDHERSTISLRDHRPGSS